MVSTNDSRSPDYLLGELLKHVSRSFYLTIRVLPSELRAPVGLAYLLARAADTIADTKLVPPALRLELLLNFRSHVNGVPTAQPLSRVQEVLLRDASQSSEARPEITRHERILLQSLEPSLEVLAALHAEDRAKVRAVVTTLTEGMEFDLRTFPPEKAGKVEALKNVDELERYTYLVAGCVGDFWTRITAAHTPALRGWNLDEMSACGIRFGKALQYTNVLRDCPKDLRIGRCYFPTEVLARHQLQPNDLANPENSLRARPVLLELLRNAVGHYREAQRYILAIPPQCGRLRLACLWPVLIGLKTLKLLSENDRWLDPKCPSKVTRATVYKSMALSLPAAGSDSLLTGWMERLIEQIPTVTDR